jgi:hypothetical protein
MITPSLPPREAVFMVKRYLWRSGFYRALRRDRKKSSKPAIDGFLFREQGVIDFRTGGVAERLNAPVLKTGKGESPSWVRIPPPPPRLIILNDAAFV